MAPIGWKSPLSKTFQVKGTSYHWDMMVVGILHRREELFSKTRSKYIFHGILQKKKLFLRNMFKMYNPRHPADKKELFSRNTGSKCIFRKVGCLNLLLSLLCLPWMHAVLPHSPLHVGSIIELNWTSIANRAMFFRCFSSCCNFRICFSGPCTCGHRRARWGRACLRHHCQGCL